MIEVAVVGSELRSAWLGAVLHRPHRLVFLPTLQSIDIIVRLSGCRNA